MKTATDYNLQSGTHGLKWYKFWTPGLKPFTTKARIIEALNLGLTVYCEDKIMRTITSWDGKRWASIT
ncbi:hypothetical protein LCGC14_2632770 [marine sediment metagenome]|uniref:Uncharacterized protein n=1 Tax=marine sediment metagenome TaxID=412755 RepID=A0A0F8ZZZ9_9ZZZZ